MHACAVQLVRIFSRYSKEQRARRKVAYLGAMNMHALGNELQFENLQSLVQLRLVKT